MPLGHICFVSCTLFASCVAVSHHLSSTFGGVLGICCTSTSVTFFLRLMAIFPTLRTLSFDGILCEISSSTTFEQTVLMAWVSFCLLSSSFFSSWVFLCNLAFILLRAFTECFTYFSRVFPPIQISVTTALCRVCTSFNCTF